MLVEFRSPRGTAECFSVLASVWGPRNQQAENIQWPVSWSCGLPPTLHDFLCYSLCGDFIALKSVKGNDEVCLSSEHVCTAWVLQGTSESCVTRQIFFSLLSSRWKNHPASRKAAAFWVHGTYVIDERLIVLQTRLICWAAPVYLREQLLLQRPGGSSPWPCPAMARC